MIRKTLQQPQHRHKIELITTFLCAFIIGLSLGLSLSLPVTSSRPSYSVLGASTVSTGLRIGVRKEGVADLMPSIRLLPDEVAVINISWDIAVKHKGTTIEVRVPYGIQPLHDDSEVIVWSQTPDTGFFVGFVTIDRISSFDVLFPVKITTDAQQFNSVTVLMYAADRPVIASGHVVIEKQYH